MPNPRLSNRYAKSILDLAIEQGNLEEVYNDMVWLQSVCKSNKDFVALLRSPIIKADKKKKILDAVTGSSLSTLTKSFNNLLVTKNRESNLPEVVESFITAYKNHKNIKLVTLTTATPVSDGLRSQIMAQVKKDTGFENIDLQEKVDADLIGGFVLQIGDLLIDTSVAHDLKAIARQFEHNDFIYKIR